MGAPLAVKYHRCIHCPDSSHTDGVSVPNGEAAVFLVGSRAFTSCRWRAPGRSSSSPDQILWYRGESLRRKFDSRGPFPASALLCEYVAVLTCQMGALRREKIIIACAGQYPAARRSRQFMVVSCHLFAASSMACVPQKSMSARVHDYVHPSAVDKMPWLEPPS